MKLAYWMYAGPAHIGVLRVSSSFKNVHAIMHAPLGDDYFNVMRSMLERERDFTPVTASIVDRHVLARGSQEKVVENITRKNKEESPDLILLTPTCTSSILQEDLHNFVERSVLDSTNLAKKNSTEALPIREATPSESNIGSKYTTNSANYQVSNKTNTTLKNTDLGTKDLSSSAQKGADGKESTNFIVSFGLDTISTEGEQSCSLEAEQKKINGTIGFPPGPSGQKAEFEYLQSDVILADVNHYRVNELQAADRTLEQIVRYYLEKAKKQNNLLTTKTEKPSVNIIGIFTLGFHNQHDCRELKRLFNDLGIYINEIIPEGGNVHNLKNLPQAWFNFVPYREVGLMTANYLKTEFDMPYVSITPMGLIDTAACIRAIGKIISNMLNKESISDSQLLPSGPENPLASNLYRTGPRSMEQLPLSGLEGSKSSIPKGHIGISGDEISSNKNIDSLIENLFNKYIDQQTRFVSQAAWFSRSIDCQNLTGKKAVVFGDATHSAAMTKILAREMGIRVSCAGTYCKHDADWFREQVNGFCDQILITDDHNLIKETIAKLEPAAIFGTQMERHVGKRLDIPCGVISAPVHIQNFPLGYRPFLGYEGTNQIADLVYNSFNLGMEDHLLQIFGGHDSVINQKNQDNLLVPNKDSQIHMGTSPNIDQNGFNKTDKTKTDSNLWSPDGLAELNKVPGFVRGKVKRNTEKYALQNNISVITVEVMYAAKEALSN